MNIVRAMNEIGERLKRFPCYIQFDMMDCGPAALASIASYYGKEYGIPELRGYCFLTKDGVSLLGIEDAARNIGFEALAVKTSVPKLYSKKPFPCILHWDNVHFVVLYNIRKSIVTGQRFFISLTLVMVGSELMKMSSAHIGVEQTEKVWLC